MDIQLLKDQLAGLEAKGKALRNDEALFLKAQGIDESIETARTKLGEDEIDNINFKEQMAELKAKKADAIKTTCVTMQEKMTAILPEGMAVIDIDTDYFVVNKKTNVKVAVFEKLSEAEKFVNANEDFLIKAESTLFIGWLKPGAKAPVAYHSLSGGEKANFDPALINVLDAGLIIVEAAEMDEKRLVESLIKLGKLEEQVIFNTWFAPKEVPKGWEVVRL